MKTFVPAQVILLDDVRECDARFDEIAKIMGFSAWRFEELADKLATVKKEPAFFADALMPHLVVRGEHTVGSSSGSPCCGTSKRCGCMRLRIAEPFRRSFPIFPCRCRMIRLPASPSFTKEAGRRRTCAARRRRPWRTRGRSACTMKSL